MISTFFCSCNDLWSFGEKCTSRMKKTKGIGIGEDLDHFTKRPPPKKNLMILFSSQASILGVLFQIRFRLRKHKPSKFFDSIFLRNGFMHQFFLKNTARCQPFVAVVRCWVTTTILNLLNVYLNCKFELSLLSSWLFLDCSISKKLTLKFVTWIFSSGFTSFSEFK